jgi:hypothetical protein
MQLFRLPFFLAVLSTLILSAESMIPIRRINSHRNGDRAGYELDEKHYHQLLLIADKPALSILDTDFIRYRPPYLKDFCDEIDRIVDAGSMEQLEDVLSAIAAKFKETVYTEVNFPHTYRPETEVRIDNEELLMYRRKHCNYQTKEDIRKSTWVITYFTILTVFAIVVFHAI